MYKNKYIKYKNKYINLKNQKGFGNTYTSIIITHNGKLRCLLDKLSFSDDKNYNIRKLKFKNCAILKLEITSYSMSIDMLYEGDLYKEDKYDNTLYFSDFTKTLNTGIQVGNNRFIFYLIRHAEAENNKIKQLKLNKKIKDPSLTEYGKKQCLKVSEKLKDLEINFLFASELVRTRQTLYNILESGIKFTPLHKKFNKVIILPCSREIIYDLKNCDTNIVTKQENDMICNPLEIEDIEYCHSLPSKLFVDWSYYIIFHKYQFSQKSFNCKDTNMIIEAIKIISIKNYFSYYLFHNLF